MTAGLSTSVTHRAGPLGTYDRNDVTCSGAVTWNAGFSVHVVAQGQGGRMECRGAGTFQRGDGTAANQADETFKFNGSCSVNGAAGPSGTMTLTTKIVSPCAAPPTPAMCQYQPGSATLSFDGTTPPTTQPPCMATYVVTVPKDADRPTSFYMIYGDGVYRTIAIPQGSGWAQHSFSHQFPSAGIYRQTVTIVETGAFAEKKTVVGANGCLAP